VYVVSPGLVVMSPTARRLIRAAADTYACISAGETLRAEWRWTGTRENEAPFEMRGVTVFEISNGRIVAGRLYMEEVEEAGADIDETVRRLAEGTRSEPGTS